MKLYDTLEEQLKQEPNFVTDDGELKKWVVINKTRNFDEELIGLLLDNQELKEKFFVEVKGTMVFNQNLFIQFLEQKNYLNDSYTQYKNKVGLTIAGKYLKQRNEVSLVWPFKDCILEGGQSREEQKREEIFFNETLAQDEITQLLEPKVLTNAKSYDKQGEHTFAKLNRDAELNKKRGLPEDTITDNLLIKGNNLLALHSLKKEFAGKVKLIYIDPPYNTGNDEFGYNDSFNHSTWLTFMKNRLQIARKLLKDDGAIFIQIDDTEMAYLKVLCDEIFGKENFKESISVKNGSESGVNAINVMRGEQLFKVKEHILYYSKNSSKHRFNPIYVKSNNFNYSYRLEVKKDGSNYVVKDVYKNTLKSLFNQETLRGLSNEQKNMFFASFEDYCIKNSNNIYALKTDIQKSGEKFKKFAQKNKEKNYVEEYQTNDGRTTLVYKGGMLAPLKDRIVKENNNKFYGTLISDFWGDIGATSYSEGGVTLKSGKKSEKLLSRVIKIASNENDIVSDFFLGSGTTIATAHKMNRKYIGIEQLNYGNNDSTVRLKNVIKGEQGGISKTVNWKSGGSYTYLELKKYNQTFINQIKEAENTEKLLNIWEKMKEKSLLNYNVDINKHEEHIKEFKKLTVKQQKQHLVKLLDKNQLYVNLSSLYDEDFKITNNEKLITNEFYKLKI